MGKNDDLSKREMLDSAYFNNKLYGEEKELRHILKAMSIVDRKYFVLEQDKDQPYEDVPYLIGFDQTISQPTTVARMLLLAGVRKGMNVLEVGGGSGWNAALLAYLAYPGKVMSVERISKLSKFAQDNLKNFKMQTKISRLNLEFIEGSIFSYKSLVKKKFDVIIVTAASDENLKKRMKLFNFDKLIIPTSEGALEVWKKKGEKAVLEMKEGGYAFVPLIER
ncbi:MAG: methyltransferase domain-containing protein [Nanoarchaeota archaeon]|nr:methyltransferase domain-containing protein [Nanoarchaeota archaeon]